jgi:hypothetical protein
MRDVDLKKLVEEKIIGISNENIMIWLKWRL